MKKAFVFDFDDTLATTDCQVIVRKWGKEIAKLTPAEYNSYPLADDCKFDYSEFTKLINPRASFIMNLAQEVHGEGHEVYILTARGTAAQDAINEFMLGHGVNCSSIICVGDEPEAIEAAKRRVFMTIVDNVDKCYFYDDHSGNIDAIPHSEKVRKYLV